MVAIRVFVLLVLVFISAPIASAKPTNPSGLHIGISLGNNEPIAANSPYGFTVHITNPSDQVASFDVAVYHGMAVAGMPLSDDWPKSSFVPSPSGGQTSWVICDPQSSICAIRWREENMPPYSEYTMELGGIAPSQATYQGHEKEIRVQVRSFDPPEYLLMAGLPMRP